MNHPTGSAGPPTGSALPPSGTVTFLFTDIEGSTKLWETHPDAMKDALARHDSLLRCAIENNRGYVFKTVGDAFCAAFSTALDGLNAAIAAQRALTANVVASTFTTLSVNSAKQSPNSIMEIASSQQALLAMTQKPNASPLQLRVRMGLHTGSVQERGGDYFGRPLNRVARLFSSGHGGQTLLSLATAELVRDHLPDGVALRDLGEHRLKDLERPERIYEVTASDLPAEFPALKTLDTFPNNLPIQLTSFVGREQEIKRVKELLAGTRLLALTGAGGAGKTRLALQVAAELSDDYPDGVWVIELAALSDPDLVPQVVATILGLREEAGRPAMMVLSDYFRAKRALLILDNCEHLIEACARFADALLHAAPKTKFLATSREALGIAGETAYRVPSLSLPPQSPIANYQLLNQYEAVRLFIDRALAAQPDFSVTNANAPAVAQICHRLDGIPLAIELAAARVKALSVEDIAARLNDRFRLLTGGSRTALPRQQTLRALIDWSYNLLSEPERVLLRRLSVFTGGWTLQAAEVVCSNELSVNSNQSAVNSGQSPPTDNCLLVTDVLDLLAHLVDKSLVMLDERGADTRYRMLETIRQYARDKLLESTEAEAIRDRHLDFYVTYAEEIEPRLLEAQQLQWVDRLDLEHDNLRAALEWSQGHGRVQRGLRLAGALGSFWQMRAYSVEARARMEPLLAHPDAAEETLIRAKALYNAAMLAESLSDSKTARVYYARVISIARASGPAGKRLLALALVGLNAIVMSDDSTLAQSHEEESEQIARELDDQWVRAIVLHMKGHRIQAEGDYHSAHRTFEESMELFRSVGDQLWATVLYRDTASINLKEGNYALARLQHEQALRFFRESKYRDLIVLEENALGEIARAEKDYALARRHYEQALTLAQELGSRSLVRMVLSNLGVTLLHLGEIAQARKLLDEAFQLAREDGRDVFMINMLELLGFLAAAQNQTLRAARLLAAVDLFLKSKVAPVGRNSADDLENEHYLGIVRAQLGEANFNAAWKEGRAMTLEQAVEYATTLVRE